MMEKSPFTNDLFERLEHEGYAVVENFLPEPLHEALRLEAMEHFEKRAMKPAAVGTGEKKRRLREVRGDYIRWLEGETKAQRRLLELVDTYRQALNRRFFLGLNDYEAHFAVYPEGDGYQKHWDNFKGRNNRIVTTVFYLNPDWDESLGGELLVYDKSGEKVIDRVLPKPGTLVTFMTEEIPHEVRPSKRPRVSIAGWLRRD
jgi:SM-20-related protein